MHPVLLFSWLACAVPNPIAQAEPATTEAVADFGAPLTVAEVLPAATLLADPGHYEGKTVRVKGTLSDVCQKKGCWVVITEGDKSLRVRMKDHAFAVAKDSAGKVAEIEGVVIAQPLDPATTQHFAEESRKGAPLPEQGASGHTWEIEAVGVRIHG